MEKNVGGDEVRIGVQDVAPVMEVGVLERQNRAELDVQIATAKAYPRSITGFQRDVEKMATLNDDVAAGCMYAVPRQGKTIEGPSARMAEIILTAWGNARAAARVIDIGGEFVTAQGVFFDLERNVAITQEVKRRITDKKGRRYGEDMIVQTANAACSIAVRNAILRGVPKAYWEQGFRKAREIVAGDSKTLANRRAEALAWLGKMGATPDRVVAALGVAGVEDIDRDHVVALAAMAVQIREGEATVEELFPAPAAQEEATGKGMEGLKGRLVVTGTAADGSPGAQEKGSGAEGDPVGGEAETPQEAVPGASDASPARKR